MLNFNVFFRLLDMSWRVGEESAVVRTECTEGQYVPHPTYCNKYTFCSNGKWEEFTCQTGLSWDRVSHETLSIKNPAKQ